LVFLQIDGFNFGDAFFAAANFLTLNNSVFKSFLGDDAIKVNFWIENARMMGGIFLTYAFVLALTLATGKENISRIRFWRFRVVNKFLFKFFKSKKPFFVVIGDGEKAVSLALDLESEGKRVAFLHQGFGEYTENIISEKKIWYLKGNASSKTGLEKTHFRLAEKVFVLNESEDENFRTVQEMEEILKQESERTDAKWFVHLSDLRKKSLLTTFISRYIQTFDIYQNTARRLIKDHPINRFEGGATVAQVVVVGFGVLAETIVMQCLRIGHFTGNKHLRIKVYFTEKEQEVVRRFQQAHPALFKGRGVFVTNRLAQLIQTYTFFQQTDILLDFEPLPLAESELINPDFSLYALIQPQNCLSLYVCLDAGIDNAAFLGTVLPRMDWLKQTTPQQDVSVFCHYNLPDLEEQKVVQEKLNSVTKEIITVKCFGNYLEECTAVNIENAELDSLAKQIAKLYRKIYAEEDNDRKIALTKEELKGWHTDDLDAIWESDKENYRESNRQAADHATIKLSLMNRLPNVLPQTYEALIACWTEEELNLLGEVEHRRWCAEKLLLGWLPMATSDWKTHKDHYQKQKLHQHLVPFDELAVSEKNKDFTQVLGLPFFMTHLSPKE
jgi:voltage-gated potassium channel Kch